MFFRAKKEKIIKLSIPIRKTDSFSKEILQDDLKPNEKKQQELRRIRSQLAEGFLNQRNKLSQKYYQRGIL